MKAATSPTLSNELADLAERVKEASGIVAQAEKASATAALQAGHLLSQARRDCPHGAWKPFLDRAGISDRQGQRLMQMARSGLEPDTVSALGGIKATLGFLCYWRLPDADESLLITSALRREENGDEAERVAGPIAYVWPEEGAPDHFHLAIIHDAEVLRTKRPMRAMIECRGDRPVSSIIHWLSRHFVVAVDDWHMEFGPRRLPGYVLEGSGDPPLSDVSYKTGRAGPQARGSAPIGA